MSKRFFSASALVLATAAAVPLLAGALGPAAPSGGPDTPAAAGTEARFEWWMPERTGLDADHDGVVDAVRTPEDVTPPDGWPVHFDACGSTAAAPWTIVSYTWDIDHQLAGEGTHCAGFTHYFPAEGSYEITLKVRDSNGGEAHVIETIVVQDFLVVALGDSYGSGQGNPDKPMSNSDLERIRQAYEFHAARVADLLNLEDRYDDVVQKTGVVSQRLTEYTEAFRHEADVCYALSPNFNLEQCGIATAALSNAFNALVAALTDVGLAALSNTLDLINESLRALVDAAQDAVDLAQEAVADALLALEGTRASNLPTWQDRRCNRSALAGQSQAAIALEQSDPHTSVTFVHLACSGAEITRGVIVSYAGVEPPPGAPNLPPQVDQALALIGEREVDAVLLSIGGNDAGFGPIVEACVTQEPCHRPPTTLQAAVEIQINVLCGVQDLFSDDCRRWWQNLERTRSAAEIFETGSSALPGRYRRLATRLAEAFPAVAVEPGRVYITKYPDALGSDDGSLCDSSSHPNPLEMLPGVSSEEADWLRTTVTPDLNGIVEAAALEHGWASVGGLGSFAQHGYCASDAWFRRMQDSFTMQGTKEGAVHPTPAGHAVYGEQILGALRRDLYPNGGGTVAGPPRPPNPNLATVPDSTPPTVIGVPSRPPDSNGWYAADVAIDWQATDPAPSSGAPSDPPDTLASIEGGSVVFQSQPSCDPMNNCADGSLALSIDKTLPSVVCRAPAPRFALGAADAAVTATVSDTLSGPIAPTVSVAADTGTVGTKSASLTGSDLAGHTRTVSCAYGVTYVFGGFQSPVDEGGVLNVVNAGRAVPLKWRLTDASGSPVTSLATAAVTVQGLDCAAGSTSDLIEETLAGGSGLQNLGGGYYQLNWKVPSSYANSCKTVRLDLGEGLVHTALFKFK
jgi:hypothetical protein